MNSPRWVTGSLMLILTSLTVATKTAAAGRGAEPMASQWTLRLTRPRADDGSPGRQVEQLWLTRDERGFGPVVWGGRHDQYGRITAVEVDGDADTLHVTLFQRGRRDHLPTARLPVDRVIGYRIQMRRMGDRLQGAWKRTVGADGRVEEGVLNGEVAPAPLPRDGFTAPALGEHPRLLLRRADIDALRRKAQTPWGQRMMGRMAAEHRSKSNMAVGRGMLYVLTGDRDHARAAQALLEAELDERRWFLVGAVHEPAQRALEACLAYDLIHDACDEAFHDRFRALMAEQVGELYHFSRVMRPNTRDASNWSALYRAGSAMVALTMLGDGVLYSPRPVEPQLPRLTAPADLTVGHDVPVVRLQSGQMWHDWLYAGPFKLDRHQDGLAELGGAGRARPEHGTTVRGQSSDGTFEGEFRPVPQRARITEATHQSRAWQRGGIALATRHAPRLTDNRPCTTVYLYSIIDNDTPGWYRVDLVEYQLDHPHIFIAGERLRRGDHVYLDRGRYPVMAALPVLTEVHTNPHDREHVVFRLALTAVSDRAARAWHAERVAWHQAELADWQWRKQQVDAGRPDPLGTFWLEAAWRRVHGWTTTALGDYGWNSEGECYNQHSFRLVLPFAHAWQNVTGRSWPPDGRHLQQTLPLYVARTIFREDHAVMHSYTNGGGPLGIDSFARGFATVCPRLQPGVLWAWDRSQALADQQRLMVPYPGSAGTGPLVAGTQRLADLEAFAGPWLTVNRLDPMSAAFALVNYPLDMEPINPAELLPRITVDRHKLGYVFRNRWQDGDDIVATLLLNRPQPGARNSVNVGGFRISGLGGDWIVRGAESRDGSDSNRLHIPGVTPAQWQATLVDEQLHADGSGIVSMDYGDSYPGAEVVRSFAVDYSGEAGVPALFAVADHIGAGRDDATWHLVTHAGNRVRVDGNAITISNGGEASLRITIAAPTSPRIEVVEAEHHHEANYHDIHRGARFQRKVIRVRGGSFYLAVLTLQEADAPPVRITGEGPAARAAIGRRTIAYEDGRLILR